MGDEDSGARSRIDPKHVVIVMHVAGNFMSALDITIVNVALPSIGRSLHATSSSIEWVVVGYLLSLAMWIPASGWFGDRFGTKRVYLTAMAIFTLASAMCGASQSLNQLIAARVLQGVGGGMLTPVSSAMLYRAYPPARAGAHRTNHHHSDHRGAGVGPDPRRTVRRSSDVAVGVLRQRAHRVRHGALRHVLPARAS